MPNDHLSHTPFLLGPPVARYRWHPTDDGPVRSYSYTVRVPVANWLRWRAEVERVSPGYALECLLATLTECPNTLSPDVYAKHGVPSTKLCLPMRPAMREWLKGVAPYMKLRLGHFIDAVVWEAAPLSIARKDVG